MMEISPFDEMLRHDMDFILFNSRELAKPHTVNGKEMLVIFDSHKLEKLKTKDPYAERLQSATELILVRAAEFGERPAIEAFLNLDGKDYRVAYVEGSLIFEIALGATI